MKIAFCGIDGCGKSTQIKQLKKYIAESGKSVYVSKVKFTPYHIYKDRLNSEELLSLGTAFEFLKYNMDNSETFEQYDYILNDRHKLCYLALAKAYGCNNLSELAKIYSLIEHPDLTVYFENSVDTSMQRIIARGLPLANRERVEMLENFKEAYEFFIEMGYYNDLVVIDANRSMEEVTEQMKQKVYTKLKGWEK